MFGYSVDNETVSSVLAMIDRVNQRVKNGGSAVLGTASSCSKSKVKKRVRRLYVSERKSTPIPLQQRVRIVELLQQGERCVDIARQLQCRLGRVYFVRAQEGLTPKARAA